MLLGTYRVLGLARRSKRIHVRKRGAGNRGQRVSCKKALVPGYHHITAGQQLGQGHKLPSRTRAWAQWILRFSVGSDASVCSATAWGECSGKRPTTMT